MKRLYNNILQTTFYWKHSKRISQKCRHFTKLNICGRDRVTVWMITLVKYVDRKGHQRVLFACFHINSLVAKMSLRCNVMCFYGGNQNHFVIAIKSKIYHYSNCSIPIFIPSNIFTCFICRPYISLLILYYLFRFMTSAVCSFRNIVHE